LLRKLPVPPLAVALLLASVDLPWADALALETS